MRRCSRRAPTAAACRNSCCCSDSPAPRSSARVSRYERRMDKGVFSSWAASETKRSRLRAYSASSVFACSSSRSFSASVRRIVPSWCRRRASGCGSISTRRRSPGSRLDHASTWTWPLRAATWASQRVAPSPAPLGTRLRASGSSPAAGSRPRRSHRARVLALNTLSPPSRMRAGTGRRLRREAGSVAPAAGTAIPSWAATSAGGMRDKLCTSWCVASVASSSWSAATAR